MAQNRQLQKIAPPKIRRIRHRRRSANVSDARFAGRHPALANFLSREATRYNALGGVAGVTSAEILASVEGVGTSTLNRNTADSFDIQVDARGLRAVAASTDLDDKGIPIV
jgi:hypothetical protein